MLFKQSIDEDGKGCEGEVVKHQVEWIKQGLKQQVKIIHQMHDWFYFHNGSSHYKFCFSTIRLPLCVASKVYMLVYDQNRIPNLVSFPAQVLALVVEDIHIDLTMTNLYYFGLSNINSFHIDLTMKNLYYQLFQAGDERNWFPQNMTQ